MRMTIRGLQEAQKASLEMIAAVKPNGALGRAVLYAAQAAARFATSITHVDTGALRASHRTQQLGNGRYEVYLDPSGTNPRTGQRTAVYGPAEEARGGEHAFYQRTVDEKGEEIAEQAFKMLRSELP